MEAANIIGVYKHPHHKDVYIIEMLIPMSPYSIDFSSFYCIDPELPKSDWQTAFGELFLSSDGVTVLGDGISINEQIADCDITRVVFALYAEDLSTKLSTPYGEFSLSSLKELPRRLNTIALNICLD